MTRRVLVVEDGTEYVEAFRRLAGDSEDVEFVRAPHGADARRLLSQSPVDALFLDVVFDRTPPEALVGNLEDLARRHAGDRARALEHLARNQGFYVLSELAPLIPPGIPVLIAHDFASQAPRLEALRETVPGLEGVAESTGITRVLERLLRG